MKILFLTNSEKNCGVHQYGRRLFKILEKNIYGFTFVYKEISNLEEYISIVSKNLEYSFIVYNYHHLTMKWLNENTIQKTVRNVGIILSEIASTSLFDIVLNMNSKKIETMLSFSLPRPLYQDLKSPTIFSSSSIKNFIEYSEGADIPIFGSFGFDSSYKNFQEVINVVSENYSKAIVKISCPPSEYASKNRVRYTSHSPLIKVMINTEMMNDEELLYFLKSNTANMFLYKAPQKYLFLEQEGCSSVLDCAIRARKPVVLSDCSMFRHVYEDSVDYKKTELKNIIEKGSEFCDKWISAFSEENVNKVFERVNNLILYFNKNIPDLDIESEVCNWNEKKRRDFISKNVFYVGNHCLETYDILRNQYAKNVFFQEIYLYIYGGYLRKIPFDIDVKYLFPLQEDYVENNLILASSPKNGKMLYVLKIFMNDTCFNSRYSCYHSIIYIRKKIVKIHPYSYPVIFKIELSDREIHVRTDEERPWWVDLKVDILDTETGISKTINIGTSSQNPFKTISI